MQTSNWSKTKTEATIREKEKIRSDWIKWWWCIGSKQHRCIQEWNFSKTKKEEEAPPQEDKWSSKLWWSTSNPHFCKHYLGRHHCAVSEDKREVKSGQSCLCLLSTNQSQLFCPHHMGHLTQMCFRLKILQEVQAKKRTAEFLLPGLSTIMVSAIQLQSEIIWNLWSRSLCKKWHRFPSLDLLSLPFTKVNHWVFFPSLPDVQQQKLEWLLESTPSTLAFKVVIWNGSHVVMLGCWLWPGKIL